MSLEPHRADEDEGATAAVARGARGMFFDRSQIPLTLMEPSMQAGQSWPPEADDETACDPQ